MPQALLDRPEIPPHLQLIWQIFLALRGDRQIGMGGIGPIPFTSFDRFATRYGIDDLDEFDRIWLVLQAIDADYCKPKTET